MNESLSNQIQLFKSVFKGREDVFAIRWEKGNKSGYMPAYFYDPYMYRAHKMKGGTFQNYNDKTYLKLTDQEIAKHLNGEQLIGVYPLLTDNTSYFLAADFDKENWIEECKKFITACSENNIPTYLERSRSGNGGHVWIFFEQSYPAIRSRKIFISILEQSGAFSFFDKSSSFDRLFPNQDFLSGKGLGNLIALPLFKKTFEQGNSCFIDSDSLKPISDQWRLLQNIKRISITDLDKLYQEVSNSSVSTLPQTITGKLVIALDKVVKISRDGMSTPLINFLKEELNFANSEFIIRKKIGRNTFGTERYFKFVEETENEVIVPRGFVGRLIRFCREHNIEHKFIDERKKHKPILFTLNAQLREHQQSVIDAIAKKDLGVIVAPPGSGKTIVALKIISDKQQPALIIVHRKQLLEQWIERIETFLGIPKAEIGKIGQGKNKTGEKVTVATIQSLSKEPDKLQNIVSSFGTIIVDECHHIPAETYRNTIAKLQTFYLYGLTATPFRKYNDGKLIFTHLGEVVAEVKSNEITTAKQPKIIVINTELAVPFNPKTDKFETLSKILVHDSARNKLILDDVSNELKARKKVVIITERKEHIDSLYQYLKQSYEAITLSGEDSESSRTFKWKILKEANYQVLITTGQFFGEGTDLQNANCLFLVYPFSFEGKLIQYIGRVQRSEVTPVIYDYRDIKIDYLNRLFLKRNIYYRKISKQATLFDEPVAEPVNSKKVFSVEQKIKIPIEQIEFRYGSIAFKFFVQEMKTEIEFEIENLEVRPEFEVLKPYFIKALKSKNVKINIHAEFEEGKLVSQIATSNDIEKINREVIEGVKFKFVTKNILGNQPKANENLLSVSEIQNEQQKLYTDGQKLLEDILKNKNFKHSQHLRHLARKHEGGFMKIRFVLSPFSFVFLLAGQKQFHVIFETLDTEEATYLWHVEKNKQSLIKKVKEIDQQLNLIRNKGRQTFLETSPKNFSKILHDYSDEKRGLIIWKDLLEEQIV
ncbi:MAG TPA: DEAD/DEAH box helicase family protein [Chitinophagaceae bacterium]|nr:DEAD/DEAH box helicase family protein [Chitinophagaceae bacterium]